MAVLLGPSLTGARVALPTDLVLERAPWNLVAPPAEPRNVELRDQIDTYYPVQHELVDRLRHGESGAWLESVGVGLPGTAFVGWGLWSPFNALMAVLSFPDAWVWGMALRLFAAMCGAYLLTRRLGAGQLGGAVAGLAYGLSGFMVLWLGWPQSHVAAFIPYVLWATERTVAADARWWHGPMLALAVAGAWLGGFPSVAAYALLAAGAVTLHGLWARRAERPASIVRGLWPVLVAVSTGTGLAAFTLLPSVRILGEFDLAYRDLAWQTSVPLHGLLTFLAPGFFGDVVHHDLWLQTSYVESVGYAGVVTLVLAALSLVLAPRRRGLGLYAGIGGAFVLLAYGFPPLRLALSAMPMLRNNVPTRGLALVGLAIAVLGGLGADALQRRMRGEVAWDRAMARRLTAAAAFGAALFMALRPPMALARMAYARLSAEVAQRATDVAMQELLAGLGLAAATAAVAAIALKCARDGRADAHRLAAVGLVALLAIDLLTFAAGWNVQAPRTQLFPDAPGIAQLGLASGDHRVAGAEGVLLPNTHLEFGIADARAHGFVSTRFDDVLDRLGARRASPTNWDLAVANSGRWQPWLGLLGVQQVLLPARTPPLGGAVVQHRDDEVDEPLWGARRHRYQVPAPRGGLATGLLVRIGTYGRVNHGTVIAHVSAAAGTRTGRLSVEAIEDRAWVEIPFPALALTEGEAVAVELSSTSGGPDVAVSLFGATLEGRFVPATGLRFDGAWRVEPVAEAEGLRRLLIPEALPLVFAAPRAVAVAEGEALPLIERMPAHALRQTAVVEPYGRRRVPLLPDGGNAEVFSYQRAGGAVLARVTSDRGAVVVSLDQALEGWRATVDGRDAPVVRVHHLYVGVVVPAGLHTVELRYEAPLQAAGALAVGRSVGALAAWALLRWLRERTGRSGVALVLAELRRRVRP